MDFSDIEGFIKAAVALMDEQNAAYEARIAAAEAEGYRVVDGGQVSDWEYSSGTGKCDWEITDARTGEVISSGHGTSEEYDAASNFKYWHIDPLRDEVDRAGGYLDGPEHPLKGTSLGDALLTFVWENEEEVRALLADGN